MFLNHCGQTTGACKENCGNGKPPQTKVGSQTNVLSDNSDMYYRHRKTFCLRNCGNCIGLAANFRKFKYAISCELGWQRCRYVFFGRVLLLLLLLLRLLLFSFLQNHTSNSHTNLQFVDTFELKTHVHRFSALFTESIMDMAKVSFQFIFDFDLQQLYFDSLC